MFADLTDEALAAMITKLRDAKVNLAVGREVQVIAAEGRRKEFTRGNSGELDTMLRSALSEQRRRSGQSTGRAIRVEYE